MYDRLNTYHWKKYVHDDSKRVLSRRGYKVMLQWMGKSLADLQKSSTILNGVPVMSINDLIDCKAKLGRTKDLQDIALIQKYKIDTNTAGLVRPTIASVFVSS